MKDFFKQKVPIIGSFAIDIRILFTFALILLFVVGCMVNIIKSERNQPEPIATLAPQEPTVMYYIPELQPDEDHEKVWCYAVEYTPGGIICFVGQFPTADPQATYLPVPTPTPTPFFDYGGAIKPTP